MILKVFWALITALPEVLKFIRVLQQQSREKRIKNDLKRISEAFKNKDEKAIQNIFSGE